MCYRMDAPNIGMADERSLGGEAWRGCTTNNSAAIWEDFVARYGPYIRKAIFYATYRSGQHNLMKSEDLIQETYCTLLENNGRLLRAFQPMPDEDVIRYLHRIATNLVYEDRRNMSALKRRPEMGFTADENCLSDDGGSCQQIERRLMVSSIKSLLEDTFSQRDQRIFWLYYRLGLTASEIVECGGVELELKGIEAVLKRVRDFVKSHFRENVSIELRTGSR